MVSVQLARLVQLVLRVPQELGFRRPVRQVQLGLGRQAQESVLPKLVLVQPQA